MRKEKSAGAIIFKKNKRIKFLLIYKKANPPYRQTWDFPKGWIEKGETEEEAAKREIEEETGIKNLEFIPGFREVIKIFFRQARELVYKEIVFFLAKTKTKKIKLSFEHQNYAWLPYQEAFKKLTFKNSKKVLEKANQFLKNQNNQNFDY